MNIHLYIPDIACESCVKLIQKRFKSLQGIESVSFTEDGATISYDESLIQPEHIKESIRGLNFRVSETPFERKTFGERLRDVKENKHKYELEYRALAYMGVTLILMVLLQAFAYVGFLRFIPDFLETYGWWLLYLDLSVIALGGALYHRYAYETKITCMVGMMLGMTIGMQTGMMIGAVLGATNGFFIGAMIGMLSGVVMGAVMGSCCGIMGVMEGMMAGLMGGTMGSMITVMMLTDHILWFMPVYIAINLVILAGLSYMLFEEAVEHRTVKKKPLDFVTFASLCIIVTFILSAVIIYGPSSSILR